MLVDMKAATWKGCTAASSPMPCQIEWLASGFVLDVSSRIPTAAERGA